MLTKKKTIKKQSMVKRMREIRDQLNKQFADMDYQEEKAYIRQELKELKKKRKANTPGDKS